jgi:hypothetical protein
MKLNKINVYVRGRDRCQVASTSRGIEARGSGLHRLFVKQTKKEKAKKEKFDFSWEGGLSDIGNDIPSVELQHRALEW